MATILEGDQITIAEEPMPLDTPLVVDIDDGQSTREVHGLFLGQMWFSLLLSLYVLVFQQEAFWFGQLMVYNTTATCVMLPFWFLFLRSDGDNDLFLRFYRIWYSANIVSWFLGDALLWDFWTVESCEYYYDPDYSWSCTTRFSEEVGQVLLSFTILYQICFYYTTTFVYNQYQTYGVLGSVAAEGEEEIEGEVLADIGQLEL